MSIKHIGFEESNKTIEQSDGKEYKVFIAQKVGTQTDLEYISCWKVGFFDRLKLLFSSRLWLYCRTTNYKLPPPVGLTVEYPFNSTKPNKVQ
jgi:hypothetical protein